MDRFRRWRRERYTKSEWKVIVRVTGVGFALVLFVLTMEQIARINRSDWTTMMEFVGTYLIADYIMAGIFWLFDKTKAGFYFVYFVFFLGIVAVSAVGLVSVGFAKNQIDSLIPPQESAAFWSEMLGIGLIADLIRLRKDSLVPPGMLRNIRRTQATRKRRNESQGN